MAMRLYDLRQYISSDVRVYDKDYNTLLDEYSKAHEIEKYDKAEVRRIWADSPICVGVIIDTEAR